MVKFTNDNNELLRLLKQLVNQGHNNGSKALSKEPSRGNEQGNGKEPLIPRALFRELVELQNETQMSIRAMLWLAVRRYIDSERSNDEHIWINGIKYPIPERNRIP